MTDNIIPLRFNCEQVGKHVKGSKKRFTWQLSLNSKQHIIILDFSFISGKVKVTVDRKILLQNQLPTNTSFQYPFTLDGNALNVIQQGDNFQLRINNKVFSHLYNQMKTNKQFKKYQDQVKDFKVNQNQFQAKKLVLNIGGIGNGMKKTKKYQNNQQHNWNAFGQNQSFPSYFENQSVSTANTSKIQEKSQKKQKKQQQNLLLLDDQKKQSSNILDFQIQVQKSTPITTSTKQQQKQYSTMQMMFSTMNMGLTPPTPINNQFQSANQVIIDNNQVDFFNQPSSSITKQPQTNKTNTNTIDFFSLDQPVSKPQQSINQNLTTSNNYGTGLHQMFATTQNTNNLGFEFNNQGQNSMNFSTNVQNNNTSKPFALLQGFGLDNTNTNNMTKNVNTNNNNINLTQPITTQGFQTTNLGMMQNLFATNNNMSINMNNNTATNNISLNQNNFTTGFNNNNQNNVNAFSSAVNMNNQINFSTSRQPQVDINQINMNDFNSIQMLFQTNSMGMSQPMTLNTNTNTNMNTSQSLNLSQPQPNISLKPSTSQPQPQLSFSSSFNTTTGVISPNMLGMNTYSGNPNPNANFNLNNAFGNPNDLSSQFATSINMNKNTTPVSFQKNKQNNDDLL